MWFYGTHCQNMIGWLQNSLNKQCFQGYNILCIQLSWYDLMSFVFGWVFFHFRIFTVVFLSFLFTFHTQLTLLVVFVFFSFLFTPTQDLMAKVRAMLAKGLQPNPSWEMWKGVRPATEPATNIITTYTTIQDSNAVLYSCAFIPLRILLWI